MNGINPRCCPDLQLEVGDERISVRFVISSPVSTTSQSHTTSMIPISIINVKQSMYMGWHRLHSTYVRRHVRGTHYYYYNASVLRHIHT